MDNYSFSNQHRFNHDCQFKKFDTGQLSAPIHGGSKALKPYLCSRDGCFTSEVIRIDCTHCGFNFCLKHRYPEEHQCCASKYTTCATESSSVVTNEQSNSGFQKGSKKEMSMIIAADRTNTTQNTHLALQKKSVDEAVQRRVDRIAIMRLKLNTRNCNIPASEQMFLFVTENQRREPVMISKHWTIGRCLDQIVKQCSVPNGSVTFGTKVLRLYCETDQVNPLPVSVTAEKCLEDLSNVFLKRDD
ncbi:unnamed protein product [Litomosoides sigmodontis]|uniref:AN1-type domain-containing protein n=1 Tax=Litomosoides sigmodontis TaxID=42156 RepID=A0A3P6SQK2_LITSI|nr:unnamed protein product [Litomosoides sigmodontis]